MEREVEIKIDGKEIPLNDFLEELTDNLVRAMIEPLKGTDPNGEITIHLGPKKERK